MSVPFPHTDGDRTFSGRTNLGEVERAGGTPLVVALHGGTYSSAYFDVPGYSLFDRATTQGVAVIALDRPGYGETAALETDESIILANAEVLSRAIASIWNEHGGDAPGIVLIAHSIGAAVATAIAASHPSWPLLGLAISGCLVRVPAESRAAWEALPPIPMIELPVPVKDQVMFGPEGSYTDDMPAASHVSNAPVPKAELLDITGPWIDRRAEVCANVGVPVFHRQGEFDGLWITSQDGLDEFRAGFTSAPSIDAALQPGMGHCIDFHTASAEFQDAELAFTKSCGAAIAH